MISVNLIIHIFALLIFGVIGYAFIILLASRSRILKSIKISRLEPDKKIFLVDNPKSFLRDYCRDFEIAFEYSNDWINQLQPFNKILLHSFMQLLIKSEVKKIFIDSDLLMIIYLSDFIKEGNTDLIKADLKSAFCVKEVNFSIWQ